MQVAIGRQVALAVFVAPVRDLLARRLQLLDQTLEATADTRQRRRALFLQFPSRLCVLGPCGRCPWGLF